MHIKITAIKMSNALLKEEIGSTANLKEIATVTTAKYQL